MKKLHQVLVVQVAAIKGLIPNLSSHSCVPMSILP